MCAVHRAQMNFDTQRAMIQWHPLNPIREEPLNQPDRWPSLERIWKREMKNQKRERKSELSFLVFSFLISCGLEAPVDRGVGNVGAEVAGLDIEGQMSGEFSVGLANQVERGSNRFGGRQARAF